MGKEIKQMRERNLRGSVKGLLITVSVLSVVSIGLIIYGSNV